MIIFHWMEKAESMFLDIIKIDEIVSTPPYLWAGFKLYQTYFLKIVRSNSAMKRTLSIISKWCIEDVLEHRPDLTRLQASKILEEMRRPLETFITHEGWAVMSDCIDVVSKD